MMNDASAAPESAIDFSMIADLFLSYGSFSSPSFFDGRMCASLILGSDDVDASEEWLQEICGVLGVESPRDREDGEMLLGWRSQTKAQLSEEQMDYEPLLPDELFSLAERAGALKNWALGFVEIIDDHGENADWSSALKDALEALRGISTLDLDDGLAEDSESEADLLALVEHARVTALTLYVESHPGKPRVIEENDDTPPQIH